MGVTKKVIKGGNGTDWPKKGDDVTIEYTGNLYDESKGSENDYRGKQYVYNNIDSRHTIK
jgi:FK506-binding protein 1